MTCNIIFCLTLQIQQRPFDGDFMHIDQGKAETKTKQCQQQENQ